MIGKPILTIIPEDRQIEEDMILARIRRGDRVEHFQTLRQRKDGSLVEVSVTVSPVRNTSGVVVGASKIARDLTEQIDADTANEHLAAIVASSDDAIVSKDLNGVVKTWNRGAERLFGYLAEEMIGRPILVLLPNDRKDEETKILERVRRGERVDHFETIRIRKDGQPVHVSVTISPIRDRNGRVIGASKVARDISERKIFEATTAAFTQELEQRVRERTAELESAHREMESFTNSIAHDLRGPLRAIVSTSTILIKDFGPEISEEAQTLLRRQVASASHLAKLVDDLLTYSRLGRGALRIEPVDLTAVARDIASQVESAKHPVVVQEGLATQGDPSLLRLLLQNLMENARKFSPDGGEIEVGQTGSAFYVRDRGIGFDMAFAEKIFIPFERLVRNEEIPGTGIGLANVKRIVDKHGGSIWANSVVGKGTTLYFTIPDPIG
jgi:PAS domain S-box-containing protein